MKSLTSVGLAVLFAALGFAQHPIPVMCGPPCRTCSAATTCGAAAVVAVHAARLRFGSVGFPGGSTSFGRVVFPGAGQLL